MKDFFEFFPYVPLLYKNRERILRNKRWAGAVIPNLNGAEDAEHHLGGMIEIWNNERFRAKCGIGFYGSKLLEPKEPHLCDARAVIVDVKKDGIRECVEYWQLVVCTECAYRHVERQVELTVPYHLHSQKFNEICGKHKCDDPTDIEEVINALVADTMRYKLTVAALSSILPKEQAETIALYAVRGLMQKSDMAYTIRLIAERFMQIEDAMQCAVMKDAFYYYASEIYKLRHEYRIAEGLYNADTFEHKLNVVLCYPPENFDKKKIATLDGMTVQERLQLCTDLVAKGYEPYLLSAVCLAEYENLLKG